MGDDADAAAPKPDRSDTDWRGWLEFQLQFKRHEKFVAMERTGESSWGVLEALRKRLYSSHDRAVVDKAVEKYRGSGGSLRGAIYKALEALTQRHCPRGTRKKLEDEMDALCKPLDVTVEAYSASFHRLLEMYTLLSLQDGPSLTTADVNRLYSNGMPRVWRDHVEANGQPDDGSVTLGELEIRYKRLEREERDEYRKRRRVEDYEGHDDHRHDVRSPSHGYKRRAPGPECSYCKEFCYGNVYQNHSDEQCYRNPKNKQSSCGPRFVPRGKCVAVFGPGETKPDAREDEQDTSARQDNIKTDDADPAPHSESQDSPVYGGGVPEQLQQPRTISKALHQTSSIASSEDVVKQETAPSERDLKDVAQSPCVDVDGLKSSECFGSELSEDTSRHCHTDFSTAGPADVSIKCSSDVADPSESAFRCPTLVKPWEEIVLAMVGPFGQTDWCVLVFVDTATQFVELCPVVHATSEEITHAIDQEWLSRYPWPARFVYSPRVPAYDPTVSQLSRRCGASSVLPVAEPASPNQTLGVLLLQVHLTIELKVIDMQPQSHSDWASVVCVARHALRTNSVETASSIGSKSAKDSIETSKTDTVKEDPHCEPYQDPRTSTTNDLYKGSQLSEDLEFAPDDMVLVEYKELRRCVGLMPRREGPYRVEAVRTNGILVIDKGKYLEQIHARRAVLATR